MIIRTCYSHLTDEELLRCTRQSSDPLIDELSSRLAKRLETETRAPVYMRYVEARPQNDAAS